MDIVSYLLGKNSAGGGGGGGKYTPNFLSFRNYTGTDLLYETQNVDTKNITSFKDVFYNDTNLETIDISNWDTSNSTSFQNMFFSCSKLQNIDVSNFNTSKTTDMSSMFYQCFKLINIDFSNSDVSKCINFSSMFFQCGEITKIKMGEGVLDGEINFTNFSRNDYKLQEIDLSGITFSSNATINLYYAFTGDYALTKLDIRGFDTSKIVSPTDMLYRVPTTCLIIVGTDADKTWFATNFPTYTNVKTVAEL
jgi:surface protein